MRWVSAFLSAGFSLGVVSLTGGAVFAQQSTATEVRDFEVVWVEGNNVVVRTPQGPREYTVPDDFRFNVGDRQVSVRELRPGMKGQATITTTTKVTPVTVTEVHNGEVMRANANSIIVRMDDGIRMFSEGEARQRNVDFIRNGQPAAFRDLRRGDRLTATVVTEKPPEVMTERQVEATLAEPEAPARRMRGTRTAVVTTRPRRGEAAAAPEAATPTSAVESATSPPAAAATSTPSAARRLPKTATPFPLIGLLGMASLAIGMVLTARRRRRTKRHDDQMQAKQVTELNR